MLAALMLQYSESLFYQLMYQPLLAADCYAKNRRTLLMIPAMVPQPPA